MTFHYRYRKQIIIIAIIITTLMGIIGSFFYIKIYKKPKQDKTQEIVSVVKEDKLEKKDITEEKYQVDIKGEILSPGIYSINKNLRVMDVITLAGGLTENADTSVINLSKKIEDEMVIIIYSKEEVQEFEKTKEIEKLKEEKCIQKDENALQNDACITTQEKTITGKISINTATQEELMTLSGIGESKAKEIISYRETNGPFQSIEEIKKVPGIGDSLYDSIKENITT